MTSAYFASLVLVPVIINGPGQYKTRSGEVVTINHASTKHDFGCIGEYSCTTVERWHKSGRIMATRETVNDIVAQL